jgi:teichuronic acid biosynthesis glycosyltransferase TuaC
MKLLMIVANYPNAGHPYSGAFNERSARALKELGHQVEVLAPRPYVPRSLAAWHARWRAYEQIAEQEIRGGVWVYRPAYLQLPGLGGVLRPDLGAYLSCVRALLRRHKNEPYDAILAFNMIGAGGLAWRLGRRLDIPAAGWATGNDVRVPVRSAHGRAVRTTLQRLDLVCYQSSELFERAADLCDLPKELFSARRHVVLPRGVDPAPPRSAAARRSLRADLKVGAGQIVVLFVGRIVKAKGVFELVDAVERVRKAQPDVVCLFVGAHDGFDDSGKLRAHLRRVPELARHVRLLPACPPDAVWQYLNAADIFAFPSHSEGMPNSLLEAMAVGVPAVAYAIPPILELDDGLGVLEIVPLRDVAALASALIELARSPQRRSRVGEKGRARVLGHYQARASMAEAARRLNGLSKVAADRSRCSSRGPFFPAGSARPDVPSESQ